MSPRLLELGPEVLRAPGRVRQTRKHHLCCRERREHAPTITDCHSSFDDTTPDPVDSTDQQSTGLSLSNPIAGENLPLATHPPSSGTTYPRSKSKNRWRVLTDKPKSYKNFPLLGLGVKNMSKERDGNPLPIKEPTVSQSMIPKHQNFHSAEKSEYSHCALNDPPNPVIPETLAHPHLKSPKSRKTYQQENHNSLIKKSSCLVREPKHRRLYHQRKKCHQCIPSVRATHEKSHSTLIIPSSGDSFPIVKKHDLDPLLIEDPKYLESAPLKDSRPNESIQSPALRKKHKPLTEDSDDLESSRFTSRPGEGWKQGQVWRTTQHAKHKGNSHPATLPRHEEMFSINEAWGNVLEKSCKDLVSSKEQYSDNFFLDNCHPDMEQGQNLVLVKEQEYTGNVYFADVPSQGQDLHLMKDDNIEVRGDQSVRDFNQNQLLLLQQEDFPELAEHQSHKEGNSTSSSEERQENQKAVQIKHHRLFNLETKKWVIQKQNSKLNKFCEKKELSSLPRMDKQDKRALIESYFSELLGENTGLVLQKTPRKELFKREFAGYQLDLPVMTCLVEKVPGDGTSTCPRKQMEVCVEQDCQLEMLQSQVNQLEGLIYKLMKRQQENELDNERRIFDLHKTVFLTNPLYTKTNRLKSPPQVINKK